MYGGNPVEPGTLRGTEGVSARLASSSTHGPATTKDPGQKVQTVLFSGGQLAQGLLNSPDVLAPHSEEVQLALASLQESFLSDPVFRARLHKQLGGTLAAEHWPEEEAFFANLSPKSREFIFLPLLADRFEDAVKRVGSPEDDEEWRRVATHVSADLLELHARTADEYSLLAYLNTPPVDSSELEIGRFDFMGGQFLVVFCQASDELIGRAFEGQFEPRTMPAGLANANSVVVVTFEVPVDATAEAAGRAASAAAEVTRRLVDLLRVQRDEDLGIGHAFLRPNRWGAAFLSGDSVWDYQESAAPFRPRRGVFGPPNATPVSKEEAATLRRWMARHLTGIDTAGFDVAIHRFRDTYERHWPHAHESLLDTAIALEALYLGDTDHKELRYRLSLRAARFLSEGREARRETAGCVRDLYDVRSLIAHGADAKQLRGSTAEKLQRSLLGAPGVLRATLREYLEGRGPEGLRDPKKISAWWSEIELG